MHSVAIASCELQEKVRELAATSTCRNSWHRTILPTHGGKLSLGSLGGGGKWGEPHLELHGAS
ncbi:MAG: hypothetical protein ACK44Z_06965, partial [Pirellulaceae bacterium]